jgi:hypothetical protein
MVLTHWHVLVISPILTFYAVCLDQSSARKVKARLRLFASIYTRFHRVHGQKADSLITIQE